MKSFILPQSPRTKSMASKQLLEDPNLKSQQINHLRRDALLEGGWLLSISKAFALHLAEQENPHGSTLKKSRIEQMVTPLLSKQMLTRHTMLQVGQDVQAGSRPSCRCPIHFYFSLLSPNWITFCFSSSLILFYYISLTTASLSCPQASDLWPEEM